MCRDNHCRLHGVIIPGLGSPTVCAHCTLPHQRTHKSLNLIDNYLAAEDGPGGRQLRLRHDFVLGAQRFHHRRQAGRHRNAVRVFRPHQEHVRGGRLQFAYLRCGGGGGVVSSGAV